MKLSPSVLLVASAQLVVADVVFENELIKPEEIFDLVRANDSAVKALSNNATRYYCIFRSNWSPENHPEEYPQLASWGNPMMFSHTKQYAPFLKNRAAPYGVEQIAEVGFTDTFKSELEVAGELVGNWSEGKRFFINQKQWEDNFVFLPPLEVNDEYNFISGLAGILPSPDWFSGFYMFDVIKEQGLTFWDSFLIRTYPWDAGTDSGERFTDPMRDTDPPEFVVRLTPENTPNKAFLSADGTEVKHVAEWECVLHTCPEDQPDCQKPDWPPENGCDILRFPACNSQCDPETDFPCERCKRKTSRDPEKTYYSNCCDAGYEPKNGKGCGVGDSGAGALGVAAALAVSSAIGLLFL